MTAEEIGYKGQLEDDENVIKFNKCEAQKVVEFQTHVTSSLEVFNEFGHTLDSSDQNMVDQNITNNLNFGTSPRVFLEQVYSKPFNMKRIR